MEIDNNRENNQKKDNKLNKLNILKQIIYAVLVIYILVTIFVLSNEGADQSSATSSKTIEIILKIFEPNIAQEKLELKIEVLQPIIRKCAHFTLYLALGFFTYNFVRTIKNNTTITYGLITQVFCSLYAITDEIHQMFIPGRSGELRDILIDSIGVLTGILICILFLKIVHVIIDKIKERAKSIKKINKKT